MIIGLAIALMIFVIWTITSMVFVQEDFEDTLIHKISIIYLGIIISLLIGGFVFWVCYEVSTTIVCNSTNNDYPQCVKESKNANEERTN